MITPMELEIAMGKLNWAEQPYSLDCQDVLTSTGENTTRNGTSDDEDNSDGDTPYFSLAAGKLVEKQGRRQGWPMRAVSTAAARLGTPAMPPKAMRADATSPPATVTLNAPQTAEIS